MKIYLYARGTNVCCTLEKLDLFHFMEIFWKFPRKRLENPISIVLSNSIYYGNVFRGMEIF